MNPFAQLDIHDDEDDYVQPAASHANKLPKKTHQQRKQLKQQKIQEAQNAAKTVVQANESAPEKIKENTKVRNYRARPQKELTDGHFHDRRSGTGRDDRPRKGRGNLGNPNENQKETTQKQKEENVDVTEEPVQEEKPEQPQGMTLDEYYKSKGINLENTVADKKEPVKKGEIKADWIKKEKLEVLKTKEDKKAEEVEIVKKAKKQNVERVGLTTNANSEVLGFGTKPQRKPEPRDDKEWGQKGGKEHHKKGAKKQEKVIIKEEDFPAL